MYKICHFVSTDTMMTLYNCLIYPHLLYAIQIWGSTFDTNRNKLLVLQKKVVRMITFSDSLPDVPGPLAHTLPLFSKLNFLKINDLFKFQVSCFI